MEMKAFTALILTILIISVSIIVLPTMAFDESSVGVKQGDWIEYNISVTGTGAAPPTHDVRWMSMEILPVHGASFSVNITSRYANGTLGSGVWEFNFTEGNVGGWIIIPANLGPEQTFYDSSIHNNKPVNVTIQRQEQKTVLGASRTITFGNDSFRHKEWDKTTGVFVGSSECYRNFTTKTGWYIEDLTVTIQATATNMWSPQILGLNQTVFYILVLLVMVIVGFFLSSIIVMRRRKTVKRILHLSQGKIASLVIIIVFSVMFGAIFIIPLFDISMGVHEINLIMQTLWTTLVIASMWFRKKGNYFVHAIVMILVVVAMLVSFSTVIFMDPPDGNSMGVYFNSIPYFVVFMAHAFLSIPAIAFGTWLVALWRPKSITFAVKSKRIAQLTITFWVMSYVAGVLGYLWLHTSLF